MKNLNRYIVILIFVALIHVIGCGATTNTPTELLRQQAFEQAFDHAFGEWISIKYRTGYWETEVHAELIAILSNRLYILTAQGLTYISTDKISRMQIIKESYRRMKYPGKPLSEFIPYARFPQGLPKDADRQSIRPSVKWEAVTDAEQDAYTKFNSGFFSGCLSIRTYFHEPNLPPDLVATRLMGKSPEYVAYYTLAYKKKTKRLRDKLVGSSCDSETECMVGGCLGFVGGCLEAPASIFQ